MKNPYFDLIKTVWTRGEPWRSTIVGYYLAYVLARVKERQVALKIQQKLRVDIYEKLTQLPLINFGMILIQMSKRFGC